VLNARNTNSGEKIGDDRKVSETEKLQISSESSIDFEDKVPEVHYKSRRMMKLAVQQPVRPGNQAYKKQTEGAVSHNFDGDEAEHGETDSERESHQEKKDIKR